jgi:hypothetical protein
MNNERTIHPDKRKTPKPKRRKAAGPPRPREAQAVPEYRSLIALAHNSGRVVSINAQAVHRNDQFEYAYGLSERLEHIPAAGDRGEIIHFYAYAKLKDGGYHFDVMSRAEMDAVRDLSQDSAWANGYAEMGKTTVLRRIARFLPLDLGEIGVDPRETTAPAPPAVPRQTSVPEIEPDGVELTEEEFFALLPPLHILHILDAVAERGMPEKVLEEIVGKPLDDVTEEEERDILRAIALWQPESRNP